MRLFSHCVSKGKVSEVQGSFLSGEAQVSEIKPWSFEFQAISSGTVTFNKKKNSFQPSAEFHQIHKPQQSQSFVFSEL